MVVSLPGFDLSVFPSIPLLLGLLGWRSLSGLQTKHSLASASQLFTLMLRALRSLLRMSLY